MEFSVDTRDESPDFPMLSEFLVGTGVKGNQQSRSELADRDAMGSHLG
jgi:hypothetical protein